MIIDTLNNSSLAQVFKLEGGDCYLFVKPGKVDWSIWSDLRDKKRFIRSGSAGLRCPASPESKFSKRFLDESNDWSFNKAGEDDEEDWKDWREGGVVVQCTVHDQTTVK